MLTDAVNLPGTNHTSLRGQSEHGNMLDYLMKIGKRSMKRL